MGGLTLSEEWIGGYWVGGSGRGGRRRKGGREQAELWFVCKIKKKTLLNKNVKNVLGDINFSK